MRDTHHSLVTLINNASLFITSICNHHQLAHVRYPQAVNDGIQEFCRYVARDSGPARWYLGCVRQLERIEGIARKIKASSKLHRYILQPDDQRVIIDCNDAIILALHKLGVYFIYRLLATGLHHILPLTDTHRVGRGCPKRGYLLEAR